MADNLENAREGEGWLPGRPALAGVPSRAAVRPPRPIRTGGYVLFVLPALLLSMSIIVIPGALTFLAAFTDWDGVSEPWWIGWENFETLLADRRFYEAILNNLKWMGLFLTVPVGLGLVAASILMRRKKSHAVFQIILLIPYVLSPVANTMIWVNMIFDPTSGVIGFINANLFPVPYPLGSTSTALFAVASVNIWNFWGYLAVIFFAAMRQTPEEQLEAAWLEGANGWQVFRYVTLPHILPTVALMLVIVTIFALLNFDYVYLMTGGGPAGSTQMLSTMAYTFAFQTFEVGKAAAVAVVISIFGIIASAVYVWISREGLR